MALKDYLAVRRSDIETQIKALKAELAEIRVAEAALDAAPDVTATTPRPAQGAVRSGTIKEWVLKALAGSLNGYETDQVMSAVKMIGGPDVPRNSMTPQLSRLKSEGLIVQEGRYWKAARPLVPAPAVLPAPPLAWPTPQPVVPAPPHGWVPQAPRPVPPPPQGPIYGSPEEESL